MGLAGARAPRHACALVSIHRFDEVKAKVYERLLRKLLNRPSRPAVVLLQLLPKGMAYAAGSSGKVWLCADDALPARTAAHTRASITQVVVASLSHYVVVAAASLQRHHSDQRLSILRTPSPCLIHHCVVVSAHIPPLPA
jgi:hypothetical protein